MTSLERGADDSGDMTARTFHEETCSIFARYGPATPLGALPDEALPLLTHWLHDVRGDEVEARECMADEYDWSGTLAEWMQNEVSMAVVTAARSFAR